MLLHRAAQAYYRGMAKPGYQAVSLDVSVAQALRDVAHYRSVTSGTTFTLSDTTAMLIRCWLATNGVDPHIDAAIRDRMAPRGGAAHDYA